MVLEGESAIEAARQVIGATNPLQSAPGSIRGDFAIAIGRTWSTAPTRPSRRHARSGSSSPSSEPRLRLASAPRDPRAAGARVRASPQRRAILEQIGVEFAVEELATSRSSTARPARGRARRTRTARPGGRSPATTDALVLGVDTLVALGRASLRQAARRERCARDAARARRPQPQRDQRHLRDRRTARPARRRPSTAVNFRPLDAATIAWYVDTGEWRGRAGGYAIQGRGAALVDHRGRLPECRRAAGRDAARLVPSLLRFCGDSAQRAMSG